MAVRSKRLSGPATCSTGSAGIHYTCPAGRTAIVKQINVYNPGLAAAAVTLYLNGSAGTNVFRVVQVASQASSVDAGLYFVLAPGDVIRAQGSVASMVLTMSGVELLGVAT